MEMMDVCEEKADGCGSDELITKKVWPRIGQSLSLLFTSFGPGSTQLPAQRT